MWIERVSNVFTKLREIGISHLRKTPEEKCIGFLDQSQRFKYATGTTDREIEEILNNLHTSGMSIIGVVDCHKARQLSMIDPYSQDL